ncbi:MAG TPA: methyltransferase [Vicinamibacterales bacterium]|nr:methyltransferase [Vicinamibacterales bacterium]
MTRGSQPDDLTRSPQTDPAGLYRERDEIYAADMLIAALNGLDFFTWLDAHPASIDDIARHFAFHPRPVDVMTTLFVAKGWLERAGDTLRLTAVAREHLVTGSPWHLGPYFPKIADRPIARDLIEVLRTGQPANFASRTDHVDWHKAMESEAFAEEFTAAMDIRGRFLAQALARHLDLSNQEALLDVAGGSGIYACALAARFPHLRAAVFEKPPVDNVTRRAVAGRGFDARIAILTGDMLSDPLPPGYDVHLWSNVLHDWDVAIVQQLLRASAAALPPGGTIVIHDTFLNRDKSGPASIAAYSVLLMHVTQGRCYSVAEMESWLHDAGFSRAMEVPSAAGRSALVAKRG